MDFLTENTNYDVRSFVRIIAYMKADNLKNDNKEKTIKLLKKTVKLQKLHSLFTSLIRIELTHPPPEAVLYPLSYKDIY